MTHLEEFWMGCLCLYLHFKRQVSSVVACFFCARLLINMLNARLICIPLWTVQSSLVGLQRKVYLHKDAAEQLICGVLAEVMKYRLGPVLTPFLRPSSALAKLCDVSCVASIFFQLSSSYSVIMTFLYFSLLSCPVITQNWNWVYIISITGVCLSSYLLRLRLSGLCSDRKNDPSAPIDACTPSSCHLVPVQPAADWCDVLPSQLASFTCKQATESIVLLQVLSCQLMHHFLFSAVCSPSSVWFLPLTHLYSHVTCVTLTLSLMPLTSNSDINTLNSKHNNIINI